MRGSQEPLSEAVTHLTVDRDYDGAPMLIKKRRMFAELTEDIADSEVSGGTNLPHLGVDVDRTTRYSVRT